MGLFDDIGNAIGGAVTAATQVVTAPARVVINTAQVVAGQAQPSAIYSPFQQLGTTAGNAVQGAAQLAAAPQRFLFQKAREAAQAVGGNAGAFIFDVGTFVQQFYTQMGVSGTNVLANVLRQQNPLQLFAAPLAAAIRAARERHAANAQLLPADVVAALTGKFAANVLSRARFTIGSVEITLPNFIGASARFLGNEYAVTVDDIIVFNTQPGSFAANGAWWAHEVTHVEQYSQLGIEGFAFEYVRDFGQNLEGQANARARTITGAATSSPHGIAASALTFGGTVQPPNAPRGLPQVAVEFFVARCFFPMDPYPVHYFLTNTNRIIVVDPMNGSWMQIGWATPPLLPNVAWTYQTPMLRYAVLPNGAIWTPNQFQQWIQIGQVFRV